MTGQRPNFPFPYLDLTFIDFWHGLWTWTWHWACQYDLEARTYAVKVLVVKSSNLSTTPNLSNAKGNFRRRILSFLKLLFSIKLVAFQISAKRERELKTIAIAPVVSDR